MPQTRKFCKNYCTKDMPLVGAWLAPLCQIPPVGHKKQIINLWLKTMPSVCPMGIAAGKHSAVQKWYCVKYGHNSRVFHSNTIRSEYAEMYNMCCGQFIPTDKQQESHQLSDVHSSSATRSRLGSDASSCSTVTGSGERPPLGNGTINCGWRDISCGNETAMLVLALLSDTAAADAGSEVTVTLWCDESSLFSCTTDADDAGTLDAMLNISTGITICLQTVSSKSCYLSKCHCEDKHK